MNQHTEPLQGGTRHEVTWGKRGKEEKRRWKGGGEGKARKQLNVSNIAGCAEHESSSERIVRDRTTGVCKKLKPRAPSGEQASCHGHSGQIDAERQRHCWRSRGVPWSGLRPTRAEASARALPPSPRTWYEKWREWSKTGGRAWEGAMERRVCENAWGKVSQRNVGELGERVASEPGCMSDVRRRLQKQTMSGCSRTEYGCASGTLLGCEIWKVRWGLRRG